MPARPAWRRGGTSAARGGELGEQRADVGRVTAGRRARHFVNGSGVGFNGMVTLEAHRIDWLRGTPLYTLAFLRAAVKHYHTPVARVTTDGATAEVPTLSVSFNLGQREGGFPVSWAARLDDGLFDTFHPRDLKRWELLRYLPALVTGRLPPGHPQLVSGRCRTATVESASPLCVHADGELMCVPADGELSATWKLLPARLRVEVCPARLYGA